MSHYRDARSSALVVSTPTISIYSRQQSGTMLITVKLTLTVYNYVMILLIMFFSSRLELYLRQNIEQLKK